MKILGTLLVLYSVYKLSAPTFKLQFSIFLAIPTGFLSGVLGGAFGTGWSTLHRNGVQSGFLKQTVNGPLKFHHEFRVTLADCPNACSQPQIKDIGIIGAAAPVRTDAACTECGACVDVCREDAVLLDPSEGGPVFDWDRCVRCGQCIRAWPTGTIAADSRGYRLLIGGKLGRHPRLATELPGLYDADQVLGVVKRCVRYYKRHSRNGEKFAELVEKAGPEFYDLLTAEAPL